ncbi:MAG: colanic acid biosynthesis glycosyltransferase WcaL, partial [Natronohydrobacter sp.]|nr:colanic acid biosynthesis glycosyltransferase WcaL [Natronohydrobacter sp.]
PELVDDRCGWLVPAGDVDALTRALAACLDASPDILAAMGAEGRARVTAAHDLHESAAQLRALFATAP